jgi:PST family polysaccharide transporter
MTQGFAKKAVSSSVFLITRQFGINIINFAGNLILARILIPADFGLYAIIQFVLSFLTLVGDGGLGAALIKKKGELKEDELAAVFTFQQVFMTAITLIFIAATFFLKPFVSDPSALLLFRISALSYFMLSFRIVPVITLERNLHFGKIAVLEILEVVAFQATAVTLAFMKAGALALVAGLVAKNIAMLMVLFFISDWKIKYKWDLKTVLPEIPFGLSFQGFHFINMLKDSFVPIFISSTLGMATVGFINWAGTLANYPLVATGIISRILFPFFSKIQEDEEKLKKAIELILSMSIFLVFGILAVIWGMAKPITRILYTEKWMPALVLFNYFIPANLISIMIAPLISAFNAKGKANHNLVYAAVWAVLTWALSWVLVPKFGMEGYGMATLITSMVSLKYIYDAKKEFNISIKSALLPGFIAFVLVSALLRFTAVKYPAGSLAILLVECAAGYAVYILLAVLFSGGHYLKGIRLIAKKAVEKEAES